MNTLSVTSVLHLILAIYFTLLLSKSLILSLKSFTIILRRSSIVLLVEGLSNELGCGQSGLDLLLLRKCRSCSEKSKDESKDGEE
jgi:hypothetical protein